MAKKVEMYDGALISNTNYKRTTADYQIPDVTLRDQSGATVDLADFLAEPGPVAMQFIFTSCATVCPVLSAGFAQSVTDMTSLDSDVRLLSISIDPEYDTPDRLKQYAKRYGAPDNWTFMTGTRNDIRKVIMAFDALFESDNKVYHRPYTYMRAEPGDDWLRIDGLMSKASMLAEYTHIVRRKSASTTH
jgi:cytochrome oxidase Cu insertion factor (SCO1/SenC/PrrC family)